MEYVEVEGNSIDEAIDRALQQLGVERDRVDVEIIANATKGLFGIGGKKARVRATLREPISIAAAPARSRDGGVRSRAGSGQRSRDGRADTARRSRPRRDDRRDREVADRSRRKPVERAERPNRAERPTVEIDEETLSHAREVLERVVQLIGTEATVQVVRDDLGISLGIEGDESGILIGRRGQTLDALEYLINRAASRDTRHTTHLVVDSQGYRQRRRDALEELARRMGERAEERGKAVTMNPMSPRDRRIVHLALQDNPALETRSSGEGYFRKLLIIPGGRRR